MTLIKKYDVKKVQPLNALLVGMSGSGKTTSLASLLRAPTLLIYSAKSESHSPSNVLKGVSLFEGASEDNLFAIAFDVDEEGNELPPDVALKRISIIVDEVCKEPSIKNVAFDSLTGVFSIIEKSDWFKGMLTSDGKKINDFAKGPSMTAIYASLIEKLQEVTRHGKGIVITLGAKSTSICQTTGEALSISPSLPYYSVAESIVFKMPTILPVSTRETDFGRSCFDLRMCVSKGIKDRDTKMLSKFINMHPRIDGVSIADQQMLDALPPDLFYIKEFAKSIADQVRKEIENG